MLFSVHLCRAKRISVEISRMETRKEDGTYEIIGCAMRVQNELGFGLREKPYENAMAIELRDNGFEVVQQQTFPILYKNQSVGDCIPDITLPELNILLEIKALESITEKETAQMLNYLRIANYKTGLVINFGNKVECKRLSL